MHPFKGVFFILITHSKAFIFMNNTYCVIMAGGIGSRFWPLSKSNMPKQFLISWERAVLSFSKPMTGSKESVRMRIFW